MARHDTPSPVGHPHGAAWLAALLGAGLALGGCHRAHVERSLTAELSGTDPASQMEFWHRLAERPLTSNDEAFHGLLLFMDHPLRAADYAGRVDALRAGGMLPRGFDRPADEAVQRGTLAVALVRLLDIRGGVIMSVLGPTPRYACRELQYVGLFPPGSPHQTFSGTEFLGLIGRVEDYQRLRHPMQADSIRAENGSDTPDAAAPPAAGGQPGTTIADDQDTAGQAEGMAP